MELFRRLKKKIKPAKEIAEMKILRMHNTKFKYFDFIILREAMTVLRQLSMAGNRSPSDF